MAPPLSPEAQKLATEKPSGWQYLLFCQVHADELAASARSGTLSPGANRTGPVVTHENVRAWGLDKTTTLRESIEAIGKTFEKTIPDAFSPKKGEPDPRLIASAAAKVAHQCRSLQAWSAAILNARPEAPVTDALLREMAGLAASPISILETAGVEFRAKILHALAAPEDEEVDIELAFRPKIDFSSVQRLLQALV